LRDILWSVSGFDRIAGNCGIRAVCGGRVRFLSCGFACSRALHILYQRGESGGAVSCIISDPKSRVLPSGGYWPRLH